MKGAKKHVNVHSIGQIYVTRTTHNIFDLNVLCHVHYCKIVIKILSVYEQVVDVVIVNVC